MAALAIAMVFVVIYLNGSTKPAIMIQQYFTPALSQEDFPVELNNLEGDFRSLAIDNNFSVFYTNKENINSGMELLVHSRNSKINWKQLFITDTNNNLITPVMLDEKNSKIILPILDTDLTLEVSDQDGHSFQCIIPKNL